MSSSKIFLPLFFLACLGQCLLNTASAKEDFFILEETTPLKARNWHLSATKYQLEREYEDNEQVLDQKDDKAWLYEIGKGFKLNEQISFEFGLNFEVDGHSQHHFNSSLGQENRYYHYKGLRALRTRFIYAFSQTSEREQGILVEALGMSVNSHDGNSRMGGYDIGASYFTRWYLESELFTQVHLKTMFFGKKDVRKQSSEREITDPFSIVEIQAGMGVKKKHWLFAVTPGFGLTNDFNIRAPSYSRLSDKGFTLHMRVALAYMAKHTTFSLSHTRRSHIFNNVTDIPSDEIDFEIESQATTLEMIWPL